MLSFLHSPGTTHPKLSRWDWTLQRIEKRYDSGFRRASIRLVATTTEQHEPNE
jgi:hypothetical protein